MHCPHLRVIRQELRDVPGVRHRRGHPQLQRLEAPHQQPAGVRIERRAEIVRIPRTAPIRSRDPRQPPATRSLCPPTYLVSEVHDEVRPVLQRVLPERPEERVVHDDERPGSGVVRDATRLPRRSARCRPGRWSGSPASRRG